ncbi:MAG TPA: phage tail tape measure protein [Nannocystis sp.]
MAGVLRRLVTEVVLRSANAVRDLKAYDRLWQATAKSVEASASLIERAADRAGAAMARMSEGAAAVRTGASAARAGGGGGRGQRVARDPLDAAISRANREERQRAQAQERAERQRQSIAKSQAREARSVARSAGLAAGSVAVADATRSLGTFASATDKARAKVKDLEAQVARNRKEMAALREQAIKTGDADGTLKARMQGLAVATGKASVELQGARKELRGLEGGFFSAVKKAASMETRVVALGTALGNLGYDALRGAFTGIAGGLTTAAKSAIDFESSMADVKKVLSEPDLKNFDALNKGVLDLARNIGIAPTEVAALTAALAQSGIAGDELLATAEDASKLAVAFGVSGDEAGQALAKLRTGLGLTRDEVNSLTGTINELSNNQAAVAREITDAVQRVGSVARAANISAESTAALASSMIASGANAEVAATGTKNFIRALGAGAAATKRQREAFTALGLSAEETAANLVKGGKEAEKTIKDVVKRIGDLRAEDRLPVLIELFGSESIGAIGPLATNIDLLTRSFELAGDSVAAATSVEKEFAARSATTEQAINRLKAAVSVLAIDLGNALLPHINKVVDFLTSPEGKEWGANAVAKAKDAVVELAGAMQTFVPLVVDLVKLLATMVEQLGGIGTLAALATPKIITMAAAFGGPVGLAVGVTAASVALGAWAADKIWDKTVEYNDRIELMRDNFEGVARSVAAGLRPLDEMNRRLMQQAESIDKNRRAFARLMIQLQGGDVADFDRREAMAIAEREAYQKAKAQAEAVESARLAEEQRRAEARLAEDQRRAEARRAEHEARTEQRPVSVDGVLGLAEARAKTGGKVDLSGMSAADKLATFNDLIARRKTLKPSERKMMQALSKDLDLRIPSGAGHKQTKMDKQLAAMDPSLRNILRQGGERDAGGDLKVADNVLDRAVFARATGSGGGGGGSLGPGPNITTHNYFNTVNVTQTIDARSTAPVPENIRSAAQQAGERTGQVAITGFQKVIANRNAGGRMA